MAGRYPGLAAATTRAVVGVVGTLALLVAPASIRAQDALDDWSTILRGHRACYPDPCTSRPGLVWDSSNVVPGYPPVMRAVGIGGEAVLSFAVEADGRVDQASVTVVRATNRAFEPSAIEAVAQWRFGTEAPGRPAGIIRSQVRIVYVHQGACRGAPEGQRWGWATRNELGIVVCVTLIPRDQLQPRSGR
ncbi:MAG: energy transducer TonB [Gemmatimonadales bacterium]